MQTIKEVC